MKRGRYPILRRFFPAFVALAALAVVGWGVSGPGLTWDESIYFGYAHGYHRWLSGAYHARFSGETLHAVWRAGQAHPPLGKLVSAFGFMTIGYATESARLGAAVLFGALCLALFLAMSRWFNPRAGLLSVISLVLMPRFFGHAHLASLEMPMALAWVLTTIAFAKGMRSRGWSVICGVLFGLALLTKINAVFLPLALGPWGILYHRRKCIPALAAMALIGPLVFVLGWPALWHHPVVGTLDYLGDKVARMAIPTYYFGRTYADQAAPWHYPMVMTLITTPVLMLGAGALGAVGAVRARGSSCGAQRGREDTRAAAALLLFSCIVPIAVIALPGIPKYDGVRLFLPAFPFLACLSGLGMDAALSWARGRCASGSRVPHAVLAGLLLLQCAPLVLFRPFYLSYYNALAGGPWGAQRLGMEATYWGDPFDSRARAYVNQRCPPGGKMALAALESTVYGWCHGVTQELREDVGLGSFADGDWDLLVVLLRRSWLEAKDPAVWRYVKIHTPVWQRYLSPVKSIPVCAIYAREAEPKSDLGRRP